MPRTSRAPPASAPPSALRSAAASAPAKCILLGEHAVVYGEPCLSVALDLRTAVAAQQTGDRFIVNGYPLTKRHHSYILSAIAQAWGDDPPVRFDVDSHVPSAGGIGSSAALTTATVAVLHQLKDGWDAETIANEAFRAERATQGAGSPNDTSVATAGGGVLLAPETKKGAGLTHLWTIQLEERAWAVHRFDVPPLDLVVGHTGVRARTATQVAKVRRFVESSGFGRDQVRALGRITVEGLDALRDSDLPAFGKLMDRAHGHLHIMGADHPKLATLVSAARSAKGTLGAKLTGAGGGGSMVALTTRPDLAAEAIKKAGGTPYRVKVSMEGVRAEAVPASREARAVPGGAA